MKRLFHLIGIFVALFSVLFFFYLADKKDIITTTENEYTFQLSKYITNTHLEKLAQKSDVTIQLKEFQNVSLGHTKMTITFLNPEKILKREEGRVYFRKRKSFIRGQIKRKTKKYSFFRQLNPIKRKLQN